MICMRDEVQVLKSTPLFAGMNVQKLRMLAFTSERMRFAAGEPIITKGEVVDFAYVIICGEAGIYNESEAGAENAKEIGVGAVIGESSLLCRRPLNASVRAVTPIEALRIGRDCYMRLVSECPQSTANTIRILGERMVQSAF